MTNTKKIEVKDIGITREGTKISIPENIPLRTAAEAIILRIKEEDEDISVRHDFNMTIPEGCLALLMTLRELHGFVNPQATPSFFGGTPPRLMAIEVGPNKTETVIWGRMGMPGITGYLEPAIYVKDGAPRFRLGGVVKGRDKYTVDTIAAHMRNKAKEVNIYKGHAIRAKFPDLDNADSLEDFFPTFMNVPDVDESSLIFSDDIARLVRTTLFTPIERTEACRAHGIPLKRGILLEGPYGVGKTLTATVTARKCALNGWTFIYLDDVKKLRIALDFARQYQPAVVFAEDIDQVLSDPELRDQAVNDILNSIDGVDSKSLEVLTILTTNNVANITQAMLRPGRLDTVVPVRAPDAKAAIALVKLFAGDKLEDNQDLSKVGELLAGQIPAVTREVMERSKLGAVLRSAADAKDIKISALDIETAASGMFAHMQLLEPMKKEKRSDRIVAAETLGKAFSAGIDNAVGKLLEPRAHSNGSQLQQDAVGNKSLDKPKTPQQLA